MILSWNGTKGEDYVLYATNRIFFHILDWVLFLAVSQVNTETSLPFCTVDSQPTSENMLILTTLSWKL